MMVCLDPDEYLEIAKKVGYENLEPAQVQLAVQIEQAKQLEGAGEITWDIIKGVSVLHMMSLRIL